MSTDKPIWINQGSATWKSVVAYCEAKIAELDDLNHCFTADIVQTTKYRGKISAYNDILDLAKPQPGLNTGD